MNKKNNDFIEKITYLIIILGLSLGTTIISIFDIINKFSMLNLFNLILFISFDIYIIYKIIKDTIKKRELIK